MCSISGIKVITFFCNRNILTATYRWICLYFKVVVTQMAFHAKLINWRCVVHSNLRLFRIVSNAHCNVTVAAFTPDVIRHLKP